MAAFRRKIDTRFHCAKANGDELKWLYLCGVARQEGRDLSQITLPPRKEKGQAELSPF